MLTEERFEISEVPIDVLFNHENTSLTHSGGYKLYGKNQLEQAMNIYKLAEISKIITVKTVLLYV